MDRAATKYHFPCSGHISVKSYDGHSGYNFVDSFRSTSWTPSMLGTYVIPSTLSATRHWVSFCLSILAYVCTVSGNPIEGEASAIKPIFTAGREPIPQAEKEQTDLLKEAIYVLYGKRGIRLFPPRPGGRLDQDEFVIPSFASGSKGDWSSRHFIIALVEYSWVLSQEERSFSNMMKCFQDKVKVQSLEGGRDPKQVNFGHAAGAETQGIRKQLRKAARAEHGERVDVSGLSSSGPQSYTASADSNPTPAAGVPQSWTPSDAAPSRTWKPSSSSWSSSGNTWEEGNTWSGREWTDRSQPKGQSKGSGSNRWPKDDKWTSKGW